MGVEDVCGPEVGGGVSIGEVLASGAGVAIDTGAAADSYPEDVSKD